MPHKLNAGDKRLLRLIAAETSGGWAPVSARVYPLVWALPRALVEHEPQSDGRGRARLTAQGEAVLYAMQWL